MYFLLFFIILRHKDGTQTYSHTRAYTQYRTSLYRCANAYTSIANAFTEKFMSAYH